MSIIIRSLVWLLSALSQLAESSLTSEHKPTTGLSNQRLGEAQMGSKKQNLYVNSEHEREGICPSFL